MNGLSNLDRTYSEYPLAPTNKLIRFKKSKKVKVTTGQGPVRGGHGVHNLLFAVDMPGPYFHGFAVGPL